MDGYTPGPGKDWRANCLEPQIQLGSYFPLGVGIWIPNLNEDLIQHLHHFIDLHRAGDGE